MKNRIKRKYLLSKKLIEARERAGLKQVQVEKTGIINQSRLSKIENGELNIGALLLIDLARLYGVSLTYFEID
jgi:transcriptional regulator with XRE-family HTH domain